MRLGLAALLLSSVACGGGGSKSSFDASADLGQADDGAPMCTTNAECTSPSAPVCANGQCGECSSSPQCNLDMGQNVCDTTTSSKHGQCVQCVDDSTCNGQICQNDVCVPCTKATKSMCGTGICELDAGVCVDASNIIYVDSAKCSTPQGTAANPYCQISDALGQVTATKNYIYVIGHGKAAPYNPIGVMSTPVSVTIGGNGTDIATGTFIVSGSTATPAVSVTGASMVSLVLENVVAQSATVGISCTKGTLVPSLTIRESEVSNGGDVGIMSSGCNVTIERNLLMGNKGGVSLTGGTNVVRNNFIVDNAAMASPGLFLDATAAGTFEFNTVVGNQTTTTTTVGGLTCGGGQTIAATIIYGNHVSTATNSQIDPSCALASKTVIQVSDSNTSMSATHVDPVFLADGYHLATGANVNTMVTNQLPTGPALDGDDDKRPKGPAYDVGAHEAQ